MKRAFKVVGLILLLLIVVVGGLVAYVSLTLPNIEVPKLAVQSTPEKVERGRYLANHVMACMDCHSKRDFSLFSGPPVTETFGGGGDKFGRELGLPGEIYVPNITPAKSANWTDGELYRAIACGVAPDGRALFNIMPYLAYGKADMEDIEAVIAYVRSIQPVESETIPERQLDFPVNIIINTVPVAAEHSKRPDKSDVLAYGQYMTTIAGCVECHTPASGPGQLDMTRAFAGGFEFAMPDGSMLRSVNITPHATGLGGWTKEMFIGKFKSFDPATYTPHAVAPGEFNTIMPWTMYAGMTEEDLGAIYEYLRTLPAHDNAVERYTPAREQQM